jgi:hypothetical protein
MTLGIQSGNVEELFADAVSGTPQRLLFASATDPTLPERADLAPEMPGELEWTPPLVGSAPRHLEVPSRIVDEIREAHLRRQRDPDADPLDAHAMLLRLKVAAALALFVGRLGITEEDWSLAEILLRYSTAVRNDVRALLEHERRLEDERRRLHAVRLHAAIETDADVRSRESAIGSAARAIVRHAESGEHANEGGGCTSRCVSRSVASKHRKRVGVHQIIEELERRGLAEDRGGRYWPGKVRP